jgi:phage-related protein
VASWPTTYTDYDGKTKPFPNPSRPLQEGFNSSVLTVAFESGHEQRRKKGPILRTFEFTFNALSDKAYTTLKDFFFARGGEFESFQWTHPISKVVYTVRFAGAIQGENFAHNNQTAIWKCSVKLVQVL